MISNFIKAAIINYHYSSNGVIPYLLLINNTQTTKPPFPFSKTLKSFLPWLQTWFPGNETLIQ